MDHSGTSPLVHAAIRGQLDALSFLLQCDWSGCADRRPTRNEALQQALIAGASNGHKKVGQHGRIQGGCTAGVRGRRCSSCSSLVLAACTRSCQTNNCLNPQCKAKYKLER